MLCQVCLEENELYMDMFSAVGLQQNISQILNKHLLFLPEKKDISSCICNNCWLAVSSFHEFYVTVEKAHTKLLDQNFEPDEETANFEDTCEQFILKEFKSEPNEVECIQSEVQEKQESSLSDPLFSETQCSRRMNLRAKKQMKNQSATIISSKSTDADVDSQPQTKKHRPIKILRKKANDKTADSDAIIAKHIELICEVCQAELSTFKKLLAHMADAHNLKGYIKCCKKKLFKRVLLLEHIARHNNPDFFKCTECDKKFADRQCLRNHTLLKHASEDQKTYSCDKCCKRFAKFYLLEQHRVVHEGSTHICNTCQRSFRSASLLKSHVSITHKNYGTMCHICAKVIRGNAAFERHQKEHLGVTMPKVQCTKCGSWHKDKYSLQKHIRRHNEDGTPHVCSTCGKQAPNRNALLSHQRYVHATLRTYDCSVCDKSFKKPITLREHMARHTGEVLYHCPHCSKTFNSNANMHSHRKKAHPSEFEAARRQRREQAAAPTTTSSFVN